LHKCEAEDSVQAADVLLRQEPDEEEDEEEDDVLSIQNKIS
jgi:hypothetical protein